MSQQRPTSSNQEICDWLRLIRSENVGDATFWQLIDKYGTAADALDALPDLAERGGRKKPIRIYPPALAEQEMETAARTNSRFIIADSPDYPANLKSIAAPPPVICARGDGQLLSRPTIAVVGARNASASGRRIAFEIAGELGGHGWIVVSGLARGIDTAAHKGALQSGTVAVMAGGVDRVYPPENEDLYKDICAGGVIVSERKSGYTAQARDFPRRNRIVSGLARAVIVVEANIRSGSLITAGYAADQGRDVFAVPGSPLDPRARGPNRLIREGATLIENAEQILEHLGTGTAPAEPIPKNEPFERPRPRKTDSAQAVETGIQQKILDLLSPAPTPVDTLIRVSDSHPAAVHQVLLELDLAGRLVRHAGGAVSILQG